MNLFKRLFFVVIFVVIMMCTLWGFPGGCQTESDICETEDVVLCDANTPCPQGEACVAYECRDDAICIAGDPCKIYECPTGTQCVVLESYPLQVRCQ